MSVSALSGYKTLAVAAPPTAVDAAARDRLQSEQAIPYHYDPRPQVAVDTRKAAPWSYTPGQPQGVPMVHGRPVAVARNPLGVPNGINNQHGIPETNGPSTVPTGVRSFMSGYNDAHSQADYQVDPVMAANTSGSVRRSRDNSLLQQARNVAHLNRYSTERSRQFGPRYTTEVIGGNPTPNAVKFVKNAQVFAERHEKQLQYHSTIREVKNTAAVVNGMIALPAKNPLLQFSRSAMVGTNRDVQYNPRYADVRAEVPSVFRQTQYPATTHLMVDRAADSLSDKREWLVYYDRVRSQGFHGAKGLDLAAGRQGPRGTRNEWPQSRPARGSAYVPAGPAYAAPVPSRGVRRPVQMAQKPPNAGPVGVVNGAAGPVQPGLAAVS
jgi:hypothetical protein